MDAIELLTKDHNEVRGLFEQFKQAKEAEETDRMRQIQKEIFYPAVRDLDDEDLTETVAEGVQEHHVVQVLMREIEDVSGDETFESKMAVLIENVEHHAEEEEQELFPELRTKLGEPRLQELGAEMEAAK